MTSSLTASSLPSIPEGDALRATGGASRRVDLGREVVPVEARGPREELVDVERRFQETISRGEAAIEDLVLPKPDMLHLSLRGHDLYLAIVRPRIEAAGRGLLGAPGATRAPGA